MSGRNWILRRLLIDAIRADPHWQQGHYVEQPAGVRAAWEFFSAATNGGTLALQMAAPTRELADRWVEARRALPFASDANDLLYQWEASRDYDPSPQLAQIRAHVLAINSADDERNPHETGLARRAVDGLANGRLILIPGSDRTRGHGTVGLASLWAEELRAFLDSVPARAADAPRI